MPSQLVPLNDLTFTDWTENEVAATLVYVGARWCSQTRLVQPILEEVAADYAGKVRIATIDFDDCPEFVKEHNITGVPTLLLYKGDYCEDSVISCAIGSEAARATIEELIRRVV